MASQGKNKIPNMYTGVKGRGWTTSLRRAEQAGAKIIVQETGIRVYFNRDNKLRPWRSRGGKRYDSRECIPMWE